MVSVKRRRHHITRPLLFTLLSFVVWSFNSEYAQGQNMLTNGGFEEYDKLPVLFGQIERAIGWDDVIQTSDYLNTSYSGWLGDPEGAKTGTGYAGFAQYNNDRAAEAIGQRIAKNPLKRGETYQVSMFAKGVSGGSFSDTCAGLAVYGFNKPWVTTEWHNRHTNELLGATLLWTSDEVVSKTWQHVGGCFKPRTDITYIVITTEQVKGCQQYMYVDDIHIVPFEGELYQEGVDTSKCPCVLYVPEVFSPNADGVNDSFKTISRCDIDAYDLSVYNRWGERVFCSGSRLEAWDGSFNGLDAPVGLYLYIVRYRRADGVVIASEGKVTVIR